MFVSFMVDTPCPRCHLLLLLLLLQGGNVSAVDPNLQEEAAMDGSITLIMNPHSELCAVQKADGIGLSYSELMR